MTTNDSERELRDLLAMCLDPGRKGFERTPEKLAEVMPPWLFEQVVRHAPQLGELRAAAEAARQAYVDALAAWIRKPAEPAAPEAPVSLASRCASPSCLHTLNWHTEAEGCSVPSCPCDRFRPDVEPTAEPECSHESWEVTGQVPATGGRWRKYRRCADCRENLTDLVEREPDEFGDDRHDRPTPVTVLMDAVAAREHR
ncbi:hypothetical protein SUDANB1_05598 [Streptomyces sp. enrichment culture]|uniref:hypothetical protein n=1 Tax=Streptomyces sp. enrichment culture TaxID=1795815 RepID=UPI003F56B89B